MLRNFSWVKPGILAGMARPMGSTNDLQDLKQMGVDAIVSLTESPLLLPLIEEFGFDYKHLPIEDFAPPTPAQIREFVDFVRRMQREGKAVVVHCGAGIGRTGTMLCCYLVSQGLTAAEAIQTIRSLRPGSVETTGQELAIHEYARARNDARTKKSKKKKRRKKR